MTWRRLNRFLHAGTKSTVVYHIAWTMVGLGVVGPASYLAGRGTAAPAFAEEQAREIWGASPRPIAADAPVPPELAPFLYPFGRVAVEYGSRNGRDYWVCEYRVDEGERAIALREIQSAWRQSGWRVEGGAENVRALAPVDGCGAMAARGKHGVEVTVWRDDVGGFDSAWRVAEQFALPAPPIDSEPEVFGGAGGGTVLSFRTAWDGDAFVRGWTGEMKKLGWRTRRNLGDVPRAR